jgi:hypothetical protein
MEHCYDWCESALAQLQLGLVQTRGLLYKNWRNHMSNKKKLLA